MSIPFTVHRSFISAKIRKNYQLTILSY